MQQIVLENEERKGWLIFYTHDVRLDASRYGCTPQLFSAVVRFARQRSMTILPVARVLETIGVRGTLTGLPSQCPKDAES